ncbi:hypothetical protein NQD34_015687 [Periophthalmus magnuspinnatus]|uniref:uncharacterized protein LOC117388907 n=1 Tax=Periophthalmus magnuspinnatus TaxID=409849 RepID=UPI00145B7A7B|nr:uncharacterized protein LOC117388907 [Periophthalmus magnuspinnatus]KAJ0005793.1 hypothetical protein NQD34_015687 [Periophthalmus magnuspinnatus]
MAKHKQTYHKRKTRTPLLQKQTKTRDLPSTSRGWRSAELVQPEPQVKATKTNPKKRRFRPGTKALMEIRKQQKSSELLIKKRPFSRLVREISQQNFLTCYRWEATALLALQEAVEYFLCIMFSDANSCAIHAKRTTLLQRDIRMVLKIDKTSIDHH